MQFETDYYSLYVTGYSVEQPDTSAGTTAMAPMQSLPTINLSLSYSGLSGVRGQGPLEALLQLGQDISLINAIRNSNDPTITDTFNSLLTTMALVNGVPPPAGTK